MVASRIGENSPLANLWDLCFGNHRFSSMGFDIGQCRINIIGCEINQQHVLLIDRLLWSRETSSEISPILEHHIVMHQIGLNILPPAFSFLLPNTSGPFLDLKSLRLLYHNSPG